MRGKASVHVQPQAEPGIIPVGAGKSRGIARNGRQGRDHPRGCGEKAFLPLWLALLLGSSPRVRGKVCENGVKDRHAGIIPAGAGKRPCPRRAAPSEGDHPRGCGEKPVCCRPRQPRWGSSPRVRGKGDAGGEVLEEGGIIPAGAGKSLQSSKQAVFCWDHPRGCGEKSSVARSKVQLQGSSPRVRGKESRMKILAWFGGIIPAGAGKSSRP